MDLREYREVPDEGVYEQIEGRIRRRRAVRTAAWSAVAVVAIGAVALMVTTGGKPEVVDNARGVELSRQTREVRHTDPATVGTAEERQPAAVATSQRQVQAGEAPTVREVVAVGETAVTENEGDWADMVAERSEAVPAGQEAEARMEPATVATERNTPAVQVEEEMVAASEGEETVPATPKEEDMETKHGSGVEITTEYTNIVWVPNVVLPNGEQEENRHFSIKTNTPLRDFVIRIYSRSGRMVYSSEDPNFSWNTLLGGQPVPQGAYVWVMTYRDANNQLHNDKGTITVIR